MRRLAYLLIAAVLFVLPGGCASKKPPTPPLTTQYLDNNLAGMDWSGADRIKDYMRPEYADFKLADFDQQLLYCKVFIEGTLSKSTEINGARFITCTTDAGEKWLVFLGTASELSAEKCKALEGEIGMIFGKFVGYNKQEKLPGVALDEGHFHGREDIVFPGVLRD